MKNWFFSARLITLLMLIPTACAPTAPTVTLVPTQEQEPLPTMTPLSVTPVESAFAPGPTTAPLDDIIASHAVTFDTADGATVSGEVYGSGTTAVIFSVMGNCKPGWREFAQLTAAQGFMALTYQWHGCGESGSANETELQKFVDDTRAAIDFVREQGAEKVILVGASLGGVASAKLAIESQASGLVVLASPPSIPQWGFEIQPADLDIDIPKLFITAESDSTVSADETRTLYDWATEPKEWQSYPGSAHGTDLFEGENKAELEQLLLGFLLKIGP